MSTDLLKAATSYTDKKEYARQYYINNREKILARSNKYLFEHREEGRLRSAQWKKDNPTRKRKLDADYYAAHKQESARARKNYYAAHKEKEQSRKKLWYLNNKERHQLNCRINRTLNLSNYRRIARAYRARRVNAIGSHTDIEWENVKKRFGYVCVGCGVSEKIKILTRDHITPLSKGGTDFISNIQPLCRNCNSRKCNRELVFA